MRFTMEAQEQINRLSKAITLISQAADDLGRMNGIHGPGNVVRVVIPRIAHLLPKSSLIQYKNRKACK